MLFSFDFELKETRQTTIETPVYLQSFYLREPFPIVSGDSAPKISYHKLPSLML